MATSDCDWKGTLLQYRDHYNEHFKVKPKISCEFCSIVLASSSDLALHLDKINGVCPKQPVECIFKSIGCKHNDSFENHHDDQKMETSNDNLNDFNILTRENLSEHMSKNANYHLSLIHIYYNNEINTMKLKLDNISINEPTAELNQKQSTKYSVENTEDNDDLLINKFDIKLDQAYQHLSGKIDILENNQKGLINDLTRVTKSNDKLKHENNLIKECIKEYKTICQDLHNTLALTHVSLLALEERLINQEKLSHNGTLLWKITNVQERLQEARSGRQTSLYSPPFYTDRNGFKMCARIYLNGEGNEMNTHISLFLEILKGEYDSLLRWPFRQKVSFTLIDQSDLKEHVIGAFIPDPNSFSFRRPISEMNIASGLPVFCPLGKLMSPDREYIKDNAMFIKIAVDSADLQET